MNALVPSTALAAYAEPLLDGRRVIVFGDASSDFAYALEDRGARVVHVYDPDPGRAAESAARNRSRNVSISPLADLDVAVRDGAFDVAFIENLGSVEDRVRLLRQARRTLSSRGVILVATPNSETHLRLLPLRPERGREPLGYYDLYDLVSDVFSEVRMLGQAPFAGYAVVDFSHDGELDVALDSGFVPGGAEEPEWFIAIASDRSISLDPFTVVQLPLAAALTEPREAPPRPVFTVPARESDEERGLRSELESLRSEMQERESLLSALEAKTKQAEARAEAAESRALAEHDRAATAEEQAREATARLQAAEAQREEARAHLMRTEKRTAEAEARAKSAIEKLQGQQHRIDQSDKLVGEQKRLLADLQAVETNLSELQQERARLEAAVASRDQRIAQLTADDTEGEDDISALEQQLTERAQRVRELEDALAEARRVGHELVRELEKKTADSGASSDLAAQNARINADLEAAQWTIDELEGRLERAGASSAGGGGLEQELEKARAELQRQAALLAQTRAASGGEIARSR